MRFIIILQDYKNSRRSTTTLVEFEQGNPNSHIMTWIHCGGYNGLHFRSTRSIIVLEILTCWRSWACSWLDGPLGSPVVWGWRHLPASGPGLQDLQSSTWPAYTSQEPGICPHWQQVDSINIPCFKCNSGLCLFMFTRLELSQSNPTTKV